MIGIAGLVLIGGTALIASMQKKAEPDRMTPTEQERETEAVQVSVNNPLSPGNYTLDTEGSRLEWAAARIGVGSHTGTVGLSEGGLEITEDGSITSNAVVDMRAMADSDGSDRLMTHLKGEDFFNVEKYPTARFVLSNVTKEESDGQYRVEGMLTIMDHEEPIRFPATITAEEGVVALEAAFEIDRTKWNIRYGSPSFFADLGDKAIKNEIQYRLSLRFKRDT